MSRVRVKVCGITSPHDAAMVADAGADAIGLLFAQSPRRVTLEQARAIRRALPPFVATVGVFVNEDVERVLHIAQAVGLTTVQLHGEEGPEVAESLAKRVPVVKALRIRDAQSFATMAEFPSVCGFLFDTFVKGGARGGTGHAFNWEWLQAQHERLAAIPWVLAGGLHSGNVDQALEACKPYAVDVSSGVESSPGVKDPVKVREFIDRVRRSPSE